jgi:hypothetical protein
MINPEDVQRYADIIMTMIEEDQDTGQVPRGVCSWDELDDSVDAEDYYRLARMPHATSDAAGLRNAVSEEVGRRLARAPRPARSSPPSPGIDLPARRARCGARAARACRVTAVSPVPG